MLVLHSCLLVYSFIHIFVFIVLLCVARFDIMDVHDVVLQMS